MERRVAVVTGGNCGIGLTTCERLLTIHNDLELCLLCRNVTRAEAAKKALLISHPNSTISIVVMDTSDVKSVFKAAKILKERYKRIDFLYLNAGIMPVTGVNWSNVVKGILSTKCAHVLSTGEGCLNHSDEVTKDGLKNIFASNVFGHYALIKEMEERLGDEKETQIIWTSSTAAMLSSFDVNDIEDRHGKNPYSSSKYVMDTVSVSLNDRLNKKNVYSHTTSPGLVMTNMITEILPNWVWSILYPLLMILRIFCSSINFSAYNGTEAMVWLSTQKPSTLDPRVKFCSCTDMFGKSYMETIKLSTGRETEGKVTNKLDQLYQGFKDKYN